MTTHTLPVADGLERLEFEPGCTMGHGRQWVRRFWRTVDPCDRPAIWIAIGAYCGVVRLVCVEHFAYLTTDDGRPWMCADCGQICRANTPLSGRFSRIERIR